MQSLPQHFSNCTSAQLCLREEGSYHRLAYVLTGLARLPKLDTLDVTVEGYPLPVALAALALYCMRTQLPQLRCLKLQLRQSWRGAACAWTELGNMTQLTALMLLCTDKLVADPWDGADVLPLKNLHSLQHLSNQSTTYLLGRPLLSAELAAGLTSLTELLLGGCRVGVLRHVSSCVALRNLYVGCAAGTKEELGQAEWAALGCLTGLTRLKLPNAKVVSASPECCAAVNSLSRLQTAEADLWSLDMLSALSSCSYLSHMSGAWEQRGVTAEGVVLPSVVSLSQTGGSPPFAAFPNLTEIEQHDWLVVQAYAGIAQHCTGLTELTVDDYPRSSTSLAPAAEPLARIGAIKSLSALTQLTRLDFMVQDNTELAVLVDVAAGLLLLELKRLDVLLLYNSPRLHVGALMHLAKLRGLEALSLELLADRVVADLLKDTDNFLMALSDIGVVGLMLRKQEDLDVVEAACARLKGSGLPCPNKVNLSITDNVARQPV